MALSAVILAAPAFAQTAAPYRAPRLKGTDRPDLNGLWQSLNEGNWDLQPHAAAPGPPQFGALYAEPAGTGIVEGGEIPYQPWALARKKENFEKRFVREVTDGVRKSLSIPKPNVICRACRARRTCRFRSRSFRAAIRF